MNIYPSFTDIRSYLSHQFFTLRTNARRDALWAKLLGKTTKLAIFPEEAPEKSPNRKFLGIQEIPVQEIIGTISRQNDFDHQFRPLNKYLRERWVNSYLTLEQDGWSPILVHKVGELLRGRWAPSRLDRAGTWNVIPPGQGVGVSLPGSRTKTLPARTLPGTESC